jgi:hemolysin III
VLQHCLEKSTVLRSLVLCDNDIGEHGALALARGLWRNRTVERLDLHGNRIGIAGAVALAHVLRANTTIRYLDVSQNNLRIRGVQELHLALQERSRRAYHRMGSGKGNGAPRLREVRKDASPESVLRRRSVGPDEDEGGDFVFEADDEGGRVEDEVDDAGVRVGERTAPAVRSPDEAVADALLSGEEEEPGTKRFVTQAMEGLLDSHLEWDLSHGRVGAEGIVVRWGGNLVNQEVVHSIIHGVGLLMAVIGAFPLLHKAREGTTNWHLISVIVYTFGLITFYVTATLRHSLFFLESTSRTLRVLDHMSVYLLIAGTYTPFLLINLGHLWVGPVVLLGMWIAALVGMFTALSSGHRMSRFKIIMYIGMGWAGVLTVRPVCKCVPAPGVYLLVGGGLIYSLGTVFYSLGKDTPVTSRWRWAWYLMAMAASTLHYLAVYQYVESRPGCQDGPFPDFLSLMPSS